MTLKDLQNEVAALGFEKSINLDNSFVKATGRALDIIFSQQRIKRTVRILVAKTERKSYTSIIRSCDNDITLPLVGRAYSMRLLGRGRWKISDGDDVMYEDFNTDNSIVKGFLKHGGSITFYGGTPFTVYDLTTYSEIYSDDTSDIPDGGGKKSYDFRKFKDFGSFASCATDKNGCSIPSAELLENVMTVDEEYEGEAVVSYYRLPAHPKIDTPDAPIDIPLYAESQLALLTASLFWLDDNPEAAEQYDKLYRELASQPRQEFFGSQTQDVGGSTPPPDGDEPIHSYSAEYGNVDGWA